MKDDYNTLIDRAMGKAQNTLIATRILDLMEKLRLEANENAKRRWIWELLQNAKDIAFDNQGVSIEISIQNNNGVSKLYFSHNGRPFSIENIVFLIGQTSTKERTTVRESLKTTGRFGTGFLTTHLLSEKVEVFGILKEDSLNYKKFILPLDRSGHSQEEILNSIEKSLETLRLIDKLPPLLTYNPKEFNTTFQYNLDDNGYKVAKVGIEDLHLSLPFTLAFSPSISSVCIKHEEIIYELAKIENENKNIQVVTIYKKTNSHKKEIKIATLSKNTTTIAIEIEKINGEIYVKAFSDDLPRLFCDFPLIGTNDFSLPIVINSFAFNPTEPRDGIWLTDHSNDPKILENKQIFMEAIELYFDLLTYASESGWKNLFYLARTDMPREKKWFSKSWFEANFQKPIREKILTIPIVDLVDERRVSFNLEDGGFVDFPYHSKKEIRERIWELCNIGSYFILPKREEIHEWYDVIWDKKYYLTLESIISWVSSHEDLDNLSESLGKTQEQSIEWLNQFYELISLDESAINLINHDKYAVIPNQNNCFKKKSDLYVDKDIEEELKNALIILGEDWREMLVHKKIRTGSKILYPVKRQEDIIYEINKIIRECKSENISESCDYLSSCFADDRDFPKEQEKIYEFSQAFWEMPQKRKIKNWDKRIWQEVNKLQVRRLIQTISECKNIEKLQERLKLEKQDTLKWLNSFIEFLINNGYEDRLNLKTSPILPNQNGNFCIKDDLFLDNGEIDEILKDILESLGYELREELLDLSIYLELPKNRERNQEFVADEITKLITPKFAEFPRTDETKQIFKSLYLWFNKNKALAENIFHSLYANRHKLYDDDEVAANMQKAKELDNIMQEFGISGLDELREALKAGIGTKPQKKEIKDLSELIAAGVTSVNVAKEMNEVSKTLYFNVVIFPSVNWDYVNRIISRAVKRVLEYLSQNPRYKFSDDIDVLMASAQPRTVITGVFKDGQPINLVIRPSDGQKVHVYYGSEFEKLLLENTEFWIQNGIEDPELLTIGKILRYTETEIIPLYPNRLR